ncbi:MAG: hypothetical protein IT308_06655 [Anaerolineaceae bacterium]|nr:hypothetical protein [Anaerolineaceae bacterium]
MLEYAKRAIEEGSALLKPQVVVRTLMVQKIDHHKCIHLEGGSILENTFLAQQLNLAQKISFIICTIGDAIDEKASALYRLDPVLSFAFDGFGIAAIDIVAAHVCESIGEKANKESLRTSIPYSPGMVRWPLEEGQNKIFSILNPEPTIVRLTPSFQMIPKKSTSMLLGIGANFKHNQKTCDFCATRETCRFKPPQKNPFSFGSKV